MRIKVNIHYKNGQQEKFLIYQQTSNTVEDLIGYLATECGVKDAALFVAGYRLLHKQKLCKLIDEEDDLIDAIEQGGESLQQKKRLNEVKRQSQLKTTNLNKVQLKQQKYLSKIQPDSSDGSLSNDEVLPKATNASVKLMKKKPILSSSDDTDDSHSLAPAQKPPLSAKPQQRAPLQGHHQPKPQLKEPVRPSSTSKPIILQNPQAFAPKRGPAIQEVSSSEESVEVEIKRPLSSNKLNIKVVNPADEVKQKMQDWKATFDQNSKNKPQPQQQQQPSSFSKQTQNHNSFDQQKPTNKFPDQQEQDKAPLQPKNKKPGPVIRKVAESTVNVVSTEYVLLDAGQYALLESGDQIKLRYVYLDVFRCEPALSGILDAKVVANHVEEKKIRVVTNKELELNYSELREIQIDILPLQPQRKEQLRAAQQEPPVDEPKPASTAGQQDLQKRRQQVDPQNIGSQINHYFSDKNYKKDDYILQHTAQHPEKYMPFKLLLNFPRVKRVIPDVEKLKQVAELFLETTNPTEVTFELKKSDDECWLIRKKL